MYEFKKTEDQELLLESLKEVYERNDLDAYFKECDEKHEFPQKAIDVMVDAGFATLGIPEQYGGTEVDIASCDTIVCVGNGVKDESLPKYKELAKLLGGKLAGTRPVCDRELLPVKLQVGQSGVMIKPKLYIGFGVSGAVNHVTGVDAEKFIAVNKDASAPIFNYCDYGIVGDMDEVCDAMIAMLKN